MHIDIHQLKSRYYFGYIQFSPRVSRDRVAHKLVVELRVALSKFRFLLGKNEIEGEVLYLCSLLQ